MLINSLFIINKIEELPSTADCNTPGRYSVSITLDETHDIFNGHFPGNPILPGVCQVEMVREIAETILESKLMLTQASHVKYLNLLNPMADPRLQFNLKIGRNGNDEFDVSAESVSAEKVFMKMKGRMKEQHN